MGVGGVGVGVLALAGARSPAAAGQLPPSYRSLPTRLVGSTKRTQREPLIPPQSFDDAPPQLGVSLGSILAVDLPGPGAHAAAAGSRPPRLPLPDGPCPPSQSPRPRPLSPRPKNCVTSPFPLTRPYWVPPLGGTQISAQLLTRSLLLSNSNSRAVEFICACGNAPRVLGGSCVTLLLIQAAE